jgi:HrpA-like RNA helicase
VRREDKPDGRAPVLFVKGRMYDVLTAHTVKPVDDFIEGAAIQTLKIHRTKPVPVGDILIFMPGR